jgi:hypothetical protein
VNNSPGKEAFPGGWSGGGETDRDTVGWAGDSSTDNRGSGSKKRRD